MSAHKKHGAWQALLAHMAAGSWLLQDWTGESDLSDALIATAHRLPQAKFIITTLGKRGAVLLERGTDASASTSQGSLGRQAWGCASWSLLGRACLCICVPFSIFPQPVPPHFASQTMSLIMHRKQ